MGVRAKRIRLGGRRADTKRPLRKSETAPFGPLNHERSQSSRRFGFPAHSTLATVTVCENNRAFCNGSCDIMTETASKKHRLTTARPVIETESGTRLYLEQSGQWRRVREQNPFEPLQIPRPSPPTLFGLLAKFFGR